MFFREKKNRISEELHKILPQVDFSFQQKNQKFSKKIFFDIKFFFLVKIEPHKRGVTKNFDLEHLEKIEDKGGLPRKMGAVRSRVK